MDIIKGPDFPGGGADHQPAPGDRRRLYDRARLAARALPLESGEPRARPVADRRLRTAADDLGASRHVRNRGDDQSEGQGQGRQGHRDADQPQAADARRAREGQRRVGQGATRCASCSSRAPRARIPTSSCASCSRTPASRKISRSTSWCWASTAGRAARTSASCWANGWSSASRPSRGASKFRLGAGRPAHPHPRRPQHRLAQHREGDQGHPRIGRAQARR